MQAQISNAASVQGTSRDAQHQLDLVRSALALIAAGGARRVTLVNVDLDDATLREATLLARTSGMVLRITPHGAGSEIVVEASG